MSLVKVRDGYGRVNTIPYGQYVNLRTLAGYTLVEEEQECRKPVAKPEPVEEKQPQIENEEVKVDGEIQQPEQVERKVNRKTGNKAKVSKPE